MEEGGAGTISGNLRAGVWRRRTDRGLVVERSGSEGSLMFGEAVRLSLSPAETWRTGPTTLALLLAFPKGADYAMPASA
jgi:hypothetical protein